LGITSLRPTALAPGMPTVAGFEAVTLTTIFAPARTPPAIINRLNQEVVRFLKMPDTREKLLAYGTDVIASSPEELGVTMKAEIAKWGKLIKEAGIRLD